MNWWERGEYSDVTGDTQADADLRDTGAADMFGVEASLQSMVATPLGEPPSDFDVVATFDSRPINAYDFNFSQITTAELSGTFFEVTFTVPNGYRMIPREWEIFFDTPPTGFPSAASVSIQQNGAGLPNNGPIVIGAGTTRPIKTFFLCEENTTFGLVGSSFPGEFGGNITVNVYGNLIAVTDVALPFCASNRKYAT